MYNIFEITNNEFMKEVPSCALPVGPVTTLNAVQTAQLRTGAAVAVRFNNDPVANSAMDVGDKLTCLAPEAKRSDDYSGAVIANVIGKQIRETQTILIIQKA